MTTDSQLSTTEPKNKNKSKLSKQLEQEQNHRNGDQMEDYQWGEEGGNRGKGTGHKKHKWQEQNRQGVVKNSTGNGEAKEFICTAHRHELRGRGFWWEAGFRAEEDKGEKNGTTVIA